MPRCRGLLAVALLAGGCLSTTADQPAPVTASDFRPGQVRRPAIVVRFVFAGQFEDTERQAMLADYEGALLEALNTRAVLAKDVRLLGEREPRLEPAAAVEKARAVGADHAVSVQVRVVRGAQPLFCAETRRPFRAPTTVWSQTVGVFRATDGATRLVVPATSGALDVYDFEADCDNPRESTRRTPAEASNEAVRRLLNRVVGP